MRPRRSVQLLAPLLALALAGPLRAQDLEPARITVGGEVRDVSTGAALGEASVSLPELGRTAVTDAQGRFVLRGIPAGTHRWVVSRLGYAAWDQEVESREDGATYTAGLLPRPELLEGITVVANRLETRRRSAGTSVYAVERSEILASAAPNALEVIPVRTGVSLLPCNTRNPDLGCAMVRGRLTRVAVYVDEEFAPAGLEQLRAYQPEEIYLIESYFGGELVHVYTTYFVETLAQTRRSLASIAKVRMRGTEYPGMSQEVADDQGPAAARERRQREREQRKGRERRP
ncbi:MAG TPA: carboxypeptidase regulatory-like domain-containing protein [Longimicrobiaceae bacterium]|nr:carboxypeptidase regulatory-like domain-containing protein [Longimicrobiaceae bacterium]